MKSNSFITVFLSLGSSQNFLDTKTQKILSSQEILELACEEIKQVEKQTENFQISSFIKSTPWGGVAKNVFVNAVCRIDILEDMYPEGSEENFLDLLQKIEQQFGRMRENHWGDRTLDIDILYFGNRHISRPRLVVPHPYIWERDFVFLPLSEITTETEYNNLQALS